MNNTMLDAAKIALDNLDYISEKIIITPNNDYIFNGDTARIVALNDNFDIDDALALIGDIRGIGIINSGKFNKDSIFELVNILTTKSKATVVRINDSPVSCQIFYPVPEVGARYICGNYEYSYNQCFIFNWIPIPAQKGWGVKVIDNSQTDYESPLTMIHGYPVTSMAYLFYKNTQDIMSLINWDTSGVTDMNSMFRNSQATMINGLDNFDTSMVTDISDMFLYSQSRQLDLRSFNTSNTINISRMFSMSQATRLDLSSFDTSNVTNMSSMFHTSMIANVDLSGFNTSKVTDMSGMFFDSKMIDLDVSNFDVSKADLSWMFAYAQLENLDLSEFAVSKKNNVDNMFRLSHCKHVTARTEFDADIYKSSKDFNTDIIITVKT